MGEAVRPEGDYTTSRRLFYKEKQGVDGIRAFNPLFRETILAGLWFSEFRGIDGDVGLDAGDLRRPSAVQPQEGVLEGKFDPPDIPIIGKIDLLRCATDG
jgi:hypothetical protein